MDSSPIWKQPSVVAWCHLLLASYRHWIGANLIEPDGDPTSQSHTLFHAPFVLVSHGVEDDPLLNYGNRMALNLWELSWAELTRTPSRITAEPVNRAEREQMLQEASANGHIKNYRGIRISKSGRRFMIEQAVVWNVLNLAGHRVGQAATFSDWRFL
jgi:hypothetical protein